MEASIRSADEICIGDWVWHGYSMGKVIALYNDDFKNEEIGVGR